MRTRLTRLRVVLALAVVGSGLVAVGGGASALPQNNYAGPRSCAAVEAEYGLDFDCTNATSATQSSAGGINLFEASGNGGTVSQTNTTGQNIAKCVLAQNVSGANTATNQSCDFTQSGDGGNSVIANVVANHTFSDFVGLAALTQDASITVKANQSSSTGSNTVSGPGGAAALLRVAESLTSDVSANPGTTPPKQTQERLMLLDVDQVATASGNNSVDFNLEGDQDAVASGLRPTQIQDDRANASDPNAKAYIYQRTNSGTNTTKGRGLDDKFARATTLDSSIGGAATQRQWHSGGGFDIIADVDSANNPGGGTVDFGTPFANGTDCATVDGFRKIGVIETLNSFGQPTTAGTRVQDDGLPIGIPGLSPQDATVAGCSKLSAPAGTFQAANLSVDGHADGAIVGAIAANLNSGGQSADYVPFNDQTVHVSIGCTRNTPNTCVRTSGGVTGSGTDVSAVEDVQFTGEVASFENANPSKPVASAEINWGDGTDPSAGTVSQSGGTGNVTGSHTYANPGTYTIDTTLRYADNTVAATMSSTATVADVLEGEYLAAGSFAVSDAKAVVGQTVTFWGNAWAAQNPFLSGKVAPSAFKGFENTINNPTCSSGTWQTKTGNSPPPPAGSLPRYMYVIVASSVTAQKSTPTGDIVHIGVVDTLGTTYGPSPSSTGSGTFLGFVC